MKSILIINTINLLQAKATQHKLNIRLLLEKQQTIPEHTDITEAILGELKLLSEYEDQLEIFKKYFGD
tara:strand:- start:291 stop:494 length:204 start_codon:yes stop_codon:yes gene_type:complete